MGTRRLARCSKIPAGHDERGGSPSLPQRVNKEWVGWVVQLGSALDENEQRKDETPRVTRIGKRREAGGSWGTPQEVKKAKERHKQRGAPAKTTGGRMKASALVH